MRCRISSAIVNHWSIASLLAAAVVCSFFPGWAFSSGYPALPIGDKLKIPVGTVLPVSLEHSLSSKDSVKGEAIEGRIMQDVLLPGEGKISAGSKIFGTIVDVVSAEQRRQHHVQLLFRGIPSRLASGCRRPPRHGAV